MILSDTVFFRSKIKYTYEVENNVAITDEIQKFVDAEWSGLVEKTKVKGGSVWDSDVYRISDFTILKDELILSLGNVRYSHIRAFKKQKRKLSLMSKKYHPRGGVVSAVIKTSDSLFINGRLPQSSSIDATINVVGGSMNMSEFDFNDDFSVYNFMENEILEELGIEKRYIKEIKIIGIIQSENMQIIFLFAVELLITGNTVLSLHEELKSKEFESLVLSNSTELLDIFARMGGWKIDISALGGFKDLI